MTGRCEFWDLPVESCTHCAQAARPAQVRAVPIERPEGAPTEPAAITPTAKPTWSDLLAAYTPERPGWFAARYRGVCVGCGEFFTAGTLVRPDRETGGWVAECCDPDLREEFPEPSRRGKDQR